MTASLLTFAISVLITLLGILFFWRRTDLSKTVLASRSWLVKWVVLLGFATAGVTAFYQWELYLRNHRTYEVLVRVEDSAGNPIDNARVWSTIATEAIKIDHGWKLMVPGSELPRDGKFTIYATTGTNNSGSAELNFHIDKSSLVRIVVEDSIIMQGIVVNENGTPLPQASVTVEGLTTQANGNGTFALLLAGHHQGEHIRVLARKDGYKPFEGYVVVTRNPVIIPLFGVLKQ